MVMLPKKPLLLVESDARRRLKIRLVAKKDIIMTNLMGLLKTLSSRQKARYTFLTAKMGRNPASFVFTTN